MRIVDAHADLFLAGEAVPQWAAAAIGQGESSDIAVIELRHDAFAEFGRVWVHAIIKADQRGRLRFAPEQRATLLAAYDTSGLSGPKFAQLHGLNYQTFAGWIQRRKRGPVPKAPRGATGLITFIEADTSAALGGSAALEVQLAGGAKLLVGNRAQLALAAALIRELTNPRPC